jgi:hypothetical protein
MLADIVNATLRPAVVAHPYLQRPAAPSESEQNVLALEVLFATRTQSLWKPAPILAWLQVGLRCVFFFLLFIGIFVCIGQRAACTGGY